MSKKENSRIGKRSGLEVFNRISKPANFGFSLIVFIIAMLCLLPVVLVLSISFSSDAALAEYGYKFIPREFSTSAYEIIFKAGSRIPNSFLISVIITVAGTALGVLLTASYAYVLSQKNYYLNKFAHIFIIIPMLFNGGLIPSYMVNKGVLNLGDTIWVLIIPLALSTANIIIMRTYFKGQVSQSLIEAAEIDGANHYRIFFQIVLPLSKPVLATIAIFLAFGYWNNWGQAKLYIREAELKPLQAILMEIQGNIQFLLSEEGQQIKNMADIKIPKDPVQMALVVIIVVPIALTYPYFQRYFVSGLTIGAIKG